MMEGKNPLSDRWETPEEMLMSISRVSEDIVTFLKSKYGSIDPLNLLTVLMHMVVTIVLFIEDTTKKSIYEDTMDTIAAMYYTRKLEILIDMLKDNMPKD